MRNAMRALPAPVLALCSLSAAQAQTTIDVSRITCEQFVLYQVVNSDYIAIWLHGYYSGKSGNMLVDVQGFKENANKVRDYCRNNTKATIMQAAEALGAGKK